MNDVSDHLSASLKNGRLVLASGRVEKLRWQHLPQVGLAVSLLRCFRHKEVFPKRGLATEEIIFMLHQMPTLMHDKF